MIPTKRVAVIMLMVLAVASVAGAADPGSDERAIRNILNRFEQSYIREDAALLTSVLSENYLMLLPAPANPSEALVADRNQTVSLISRRWSNVDYLEHGHSDVEIFIDGPAARSTSTINDRLADGSRGTSRILHIYAREPGGWKVVFSSGLLAGD